MNYIASPRQAFLALVDDDAHSARLLTRMLLAHGSPPVQWLDSAGAGAAELGDILADSLRQRPSLVIVDLKASSTATRVFVTTLRQMEGADALLIAAMSPSLDRDTRNALLDAGANAVFERHADVNAYRREAANLVSYWVRNQRIYANGP